MARGPIVPKIKKAKKGQLRLKGISGIPVNSTEQEVKIAEGLAKHRKKIKACVDAGVSEANARSNSSEICSRPGVVAALSKALKRAELGVDNIAATIKDGYAAQKQIVVKGKVKEYPDHAERRQTARFHAELENLIPDKKVKLEHSGSLDFAQRLERAKQRAKELAIAGTQRKAD